MDAVEPNADDAGAGRDGVVRVSAVKPIDTGLGQARQALGEPSLTRWFCACASYDDDPGMVVCWRCEQPLAEIDGNASTNAGMIDNLLGVGVRTRQERDAIHDQHKHLGDALTLIRQERDRYLEALQDIGDADLECKPDGWACVKRANQAMKAPDDCWHGYKVAGGSGDCPACEAETEPAPICDGEFAGPNACNCGDPKRHL